MADIDIDPFEEHKSRPEEPTDENIPLSSVGPGGRSIWEQTLEIGEQEASFRGRESQRNRLLRNRVEGLYKKLSQRTSQVFLFEVINCTSKTR